MLYIDKKMIRYIFLSLILSASVVLTAQTDDSKTLEFNMSNARMDSLLKSTVEDIEGSPGSWQMNYGERVVLIITDENANRMRIFSPVIAEEDLEEGQLSKMLGANFHSALDAKYSLYEGFVISIFTHPLQELTDAQFIDALRQVVILNHTFGTTYQSTDLVFPGGIEQEEAPKVNEKPVKRT